MIGQVFAKLYFSILLFWKTSLTTCQGNYRNDSSALVGSNCNPYLQQQEYDEVGMRREVIFFRELMVFLVDYEDRFEAFDNIEIEVPGKAAKITKLYRRHDGSNTAPATCSFVHFFKYEIFGNTYFIKLARSQFGLLDDVALRYLNLQHNNIARIFNSTYASEIYANQQSEQEKIAKYEAVAQPEEADAIYGDFTRLDPGKNFYATLIEYLPLSLDDDFAVRLDSNVLPAIGEEEKLVMTAEMILDMGLDIANAIKYMNEDQNIFNLSIIKENIGACINKEGKVVFKLISFNCLGQILGSDDVEDEFNHKKGFLPGWNTKKMRIKKSDILSLYKIILRYTINYESKIQRVTKASLLTLHCEKKLQILRSTVESIRKSEIQDIPSPTELIKIFEDAIANIRKLQR